MITDPSTKPPKAKKGCFFYGCLTLLILGVFLCVTVFFAARYGMRKVANLIEQYTETTAGQIPVSQMPADQVADLLKRYQEFKSAIEAGRPTPPLRLTGDDINALIASVPDWNDLKGRAFVAIEGEDLSAKVSFPIDQFAQLPWLGQAKGRYLNGAATVGITTVNGRISVSFKSLEVKGNSLPEPALVQLRSQNLLEKSYQQTNSSISKLGSAEVKDGVLTLQGKQ